jgi:hypothetical protein
MRSRYPKIHRSIVGLDLPSFGNVARIPFDRRHSDAARV